MTDNSTARLWYEQRERILHDVRLMDKWVIIAPDGAVFCGERFRDVVNKAEDHERRVINKQAIEAETRRYRAAKGWWA